MPLTRIQSPNMGLSAFDTLTGFEGVVIGHATHVTGCDTVCLGGKLDSNGNPADGQWFDINRVELASNTKRWTPSGFVKEGGASAPLPRIR